MNISATDLHTVGYSHLKSIFVHVIKNGKGPRIENGSVIEDDFSFNVVIIF